MEAAVEFANNALMGVQTKGRKVVLTRQELRDYLITTYLIADVNRMREVIKQYNELTDWTKDELVGEVHLALLATWDALRNVPSCKGKFKPMELEDILEDRPIEELFK